MHPPAIITSALSKPTAFSIVSITDLLYNETQQNQSQRVTGYLDANENVFHDYKPPDVFDLLLNQLSSKEVIAFDPVNVTALKDNIEKMPSLVNIDQFPRKKRFAGDEIHFVNILSTIYKCMFIMTSNLRTNKITNVLQ